MKWVKLSCPNFSSRNRKLFNQNHIKTAVKKKKPFFLFLLLLCSFFCWWSESSSKKGFHFLFEDPYAKNIMWWIESFPIMSLYVERKLWYIQRKRRKRERSEYIEKLKALWIERKHLFSFLHSIIIAVGTKTDASYPLHICTRSCTFVHSNILILYQLNTGYRK